KEIVGKDVPAKQCRPLRRRSAPVNMIRFRVIQDFPFPHPTTAGESAHGPGAGRYGRPCAAGSARGSTLASADGFQIARSSSGIPSRAFRKSTTRFSTTSTTVLVIAFMGSFARYRIVRFRTVYSSPKHGFRWSGCRGLADPALFGLK